MRSKALHSAYNAFRPVLEVGHKPNTSGIVHRVGSPALQVLHFFPALRNSMKLDQIGDLKVFGGLVMDEKLIIQIFER